MSGGLRICYVNQDFPPEVGAGPARILELSRHWTRAGAEVTVLTGMPWRRMAGRPDGEIHPDYKGKLFIDEEVDGIRVLRSWIFSSPNRGFAHTLINNASFMGTGALHGVLRAGRFDVVIASSPPFLAHVTGEALRVVKRIPMVLEIRDLWPDYMVEMGVLKNRRAQGMLFGLERYLLRRASRAVVVTESFRTRLAGKGFDPERVDVIPNGVDLERYRRDPSLDPPIPEMRMGGNRRHSRESGNPSSPSHHGEIVVGYLGNFGAGQEIRTVVETAKLLETRAPHVRFVLAGDGKEKALVEQRAAELGLRNLTIHPPIEKDRTPAFYNACDICLVPLAPIPIFQETVPSKLFEVMACERPLIAGVAGEAARIVEASEGGEVTAPGDAGALAEAIIRVGQMSVETRAAMGRRARAYASTHYSREALAARYLRMLHGVAGGGPAGASGARRATSGPSAS